MIRKSILAILCIISVVACSKRNNLNSELLEIENPLSSKELKSSNSDSPRGEMSGFYNYLGSFTFNWSFNVDVEDCRLNVSGPGTNFTIPYYSTSYNYVGPSGSSYSASINCKKKGSNLTDKRISASASVKIPEFSGPPNTDGCPSHSSELVVVQYLRDLGGSQGGHRYKQNGELLMEIPPDPYSMKTYVVRYKRRFSNDEWQFSQAVHGIGASVFNEQRVFIIINNLQDGTEYELQLGIICGIPTSFGPSHFDRTLDL